MLKTSGIDKGVAICYSGCCITRQHNGHYNRKKEDRAVKVNCALAMCCMLVAVCLTGVGCDTEYSNPAPRVEKSAVRKIPTSYVIEERKRVVSLISDGYYVFRDDGLCLFVVHNFHVGRQAGLLAVTQVEPWHCDKNESMEKKESKQ